MARRRVIHDEDEVPTITENHALLVEGFPPNVQLTLELIEGLKVRSSKGYEMKAKELKPLLADLIDLGYVAQGPHPADKTTPTYWLVNDMPEIRDQITPTQTLQPVERRAPPPKKPRPDPEPVEGQGTTLLPVQGQGKTLHNFFGPKTTTAQQQQNDDDDDELHDDDTIDVDAENEPQGGKDTDPKTVPPAFRDGMGVVLTVNVAGDA
jgi:hypothetical protein